jgi:hypothetical protein
MHPLQNIKSKFFYRWKVVLHYDQNGYIDTSWILVVIGKFCIGREVHFQVDGKFWVKKIKSK